MIITQRTGPECVCPFEFSLIFRVGDCIRGFQAVFQRAVDFRHGGAVNTLRERGFGRELWLGLVHHSHPMRYFSTLLDSDAITKLNDHIATLEWRQEIWVVKYTVERTLKWRLATNDMHIEATSTQWGTK